MGKRKWQRPLSSPTYQSWVGMMARCYNSKNVAYSYYGGRGIAVMARWHSYDNFYDDVGERPEAMTIERVKSDGMYGPGNWRWATRKEQQNNQRRTVYVEHAGKRLTLSQWSAELNIPYRLL